MNIDGAGGAANYRIENAPDEDAAIDRAIQLYLRPETGRHQVKLREDGLAGARITATRLKCLECGTDPCECCSVCRGPCRGH